MINTGVTTPAIMAKACWKPIERKGGIRGTVSKVKREEKGQKSSAEKMKRGMLALTHDDGEQDGKLGLEAKEGRLASGLFAEAGDGGHAEEGIVVVAEPAILCEELVVEGVEGRDLGCGVLEFVVLWVGRDLVDGRGCRRWF